MILLALSIVPARAGAATIAVTTEEDLFAPAGGPCSMRQAIQAANTDAAFGGCAAGTGADTIDLPAGEFAFTRAGANENANATGDLDITADLTITGAGATTTTIDAKGIDRALEVRPGRVVTILGVTITGGRAPDGADGVNQTGSAGATGSGTVGQPGGPGGGILNAGSLTVADSAISGNAAGAGGDGGNGRGGDGAPGTGSAAGGDGGTGVGAVGGRGGDGGGIFTSGVLTLTRVTVAQNTAGAGGRSGDGTGGNAGPAPSGDGGTGGGGIGGAGGGGGGGGGIAEGSGGALTVEGSTITGNVTGAGGATGVGLGGLGGGTGGTSAHGGAGGSGIGGIGGIGGDGGGISAADPVVISGSLIAGNATGAGGASAAATGGAGGVTTGPSAVSGNGGAGIAGIAGTPGSGGGLSVASGSAVDVTMDGNRTGRGGDVGVGTGGKGGNAINTPGNGGIGIGGIAGNGGRGGAVATRNATPLTVSHATIASNLVGAGGTAATGVGGAGGTNGSVTGSTGAGIGGINGTAGQGAATFTFNGSGTDPLTVANSVITANGVPACSGTLTDGGHNISLADATCPGANVDPLLGPLAGNGGPTQTRSLGAGSPAIDFVPATGAGCPAVDQRGVARPQGPACDVGAYEVAPPTVATGGTSALATTTATVTGSVNPNGRATTYHFELGPTDGYGSVTPDAAAGAGIGAVAVEAAIEGLTPGTTTHYRLVASNADGTSLGADQTLTTPTFGVAIETAVTRLTRSRTAPVTLACPAETLVRCAGELKLTARVKVRKRVAAKKKTIVVGKAPFELAAGARQDVLVAVKRKAARSIRRVKRRGLQSTATATAADAAGNQGVTTAVVTIKRAKRK